MIRKFCAAIIIALHTFGVFASTGPDVPDTPAERHLALSDEALAAAQYGHAAEVSRSFLDRYINTNTCTSSQFAHHISNLRRAYEGLGRTDVYHTYCQQLFESIDRTRTGTLVRAFLTMALDCKGDAAATSMSRHSFNHFDETGEACAFFERNIDAVTRHIPDDKPMVSAWLHIVYADLLCFSREFDRAADEIASADSILSFKLPHDTSARLLVGIASEMVAAQSGNWQKAVDLATRNLDMASKLSPTSKEVHALKSRLTLYFLNLNRPDKAAALTDDDVVRASVFEAAPAIIDYNALQGSYIPNSPADVIAGRDIYLDRLNAAEALFASGQEQKATGYAAKVLFDLQKELATRYAAFAFNRADAALKAKVDMLVDAAPAYAARITGDSLLQQLAYNAALIHKQLSLSSGNLYREAAVAMGNEAILKRYTELADTRILLEKTTPEQADSLLKRIAVLESYIQRNLSTRTKVTPASLPVWKDVRDALTSEEAAIEFMIAPTAQGEKYIASIIQHDSTYPTTIVLCDVDSVNIHTDLFGSNSFYNIFWKPVEECLKNVSRIFFAPVGVLNLIPIEYARVDDSMMFNGRYSVDRLSSTRRLCHRRAAPATDGIILYGGIKYDLDNTEIQTSQADDTFNDAVANNDSAKAALRSGIRYLPATLDEVHHIAAMFDNNGADTRIMEGASATELTFRKLDGLNIPIIHLATHGFSLPHKTRSRLGRILGSRDRLSTFEEQTLGRSGLMMAGAANSVNSTDKTTINSGNDGLLTAREISRLNLSGVGMVVLSACESGLGEINSEGVTGLQRGLKRAGVQTLVMSLWKVDDAATSLLMKDFYRNLLMGSQPSEALRSAQRTLCAVDGGRYANPLYWAAFIVLDAL